MTTTRYDATLRRDAARVITFHARRGALRVNDFIEYYLAGGWDDFDDEQQAEISWAIRLLDPSTD